MPIRKELRYLYPIDWRELSVQIRFVRAQGRCERCGRPHGTWVWHLGDGRWWDAAQDIWRSGKGRAVAWPSQGEQRTRLKRTRVILATAHRDHDPSHNRSRNLAALCQRCHLLHDRTEHLRRRRQGYRARRAVGDLFNHLPQSFRGGNRP
ncbi:hypothetical protein [Marinivivus vitaminiproducens]|uniref:hypothetical protein n=1 Tax=Marinivivus vitaminiproducens TaxID=3035935 RepID=UPI00279981B8|nr:hypothetical protein P4R82_25315 [Geminicoccaceae bacterium SCSIO 64248]